MIKKTKSEISTQKAYFSSLILHLLLLAIVASGAFFNKGTGVSSDKKGDKKESKSEHDDKDAGVITPKPEKYDVSLVTKDELNGKTEDKSPEQRFATRECPDMWYGGIGVGFSKSAFPAEDTIDLNDVPEGYPAYKAGIRKGDKLINGNESFRGDPGTEVVVIVKKPDGQIKEYRMIRERICVEKDPNVK